MVERDRRDWGVRAPARVGGELSWAPLGEVFDSLGQGLLAEDRDGTAVAVNRRYVELTAAAPDGAAASTSPLVAHGHRRAGLPVDDEVLLADGRVIERGYRPVDEAAGGGHLWVFRDGTGARLLEERLGVEYERLVDLNHAKDRFLATVSHVLKTPLTSIASAAELLTMPAADPADRAELLGIVERNTGRLLELVDHLLFLAQIDARALPIEPGLLDLAQLVTEAAEARRDAMSDLGLALDVTTTPGPPVNAEPERLGRVLAGLLSNAECYTPVEGRVTVRARPGEQEWTVTVTDTGLGIPAGELTAVFEEFRRGSNAWAGRSAGSGVGLTISRRIAELYGGTVRLESVEGAGTTATLTLPFAYTDPGRRA